MNNTRRRSRAVAVVMAVPAITGIGLAAGATSAFADQATNVTTPTLSANGATISATATMTGDCSSSRCDTYFKIEEQVLPARFTLAHGDTPPTWKDVTGEWISRQSGAITITGIPDDGTHVYRAVVFDYAREVQPVDPDLMQDASPPDGDGPGSEETGVTSYSDNYDGTMEVGTPYLSSETTLTTDFAGGLAEY